MDTKIYQEKEYKKIIADLNNGQVVGFPTETVYGLAVVSDNLDALEKLYQIKGRDENKPISLMVSDITTIKKIAKVNKWQEKILKEFMPGPLTVILKSKKIIIPNYITLGIRIPKHDLILKILQTINKPLLVTSANLSNSPSLNKYIDVYKTFNGKIASLIALDANNSLASSVIDITSRPIKVLRKGLISEEDINKCLKKEGKQKMKKIIAIGCDHGGLELKNSIIKHYKNKYEFIDVGTYDTTSCDYPDYAFKVGEIVNQNKANFGILICKSGIGMSIAANKVPNIRCALVCNAKNAMLAHKHNNANVLAMGSNDVSKNIAYKIIDSYESVEFEERHSLRISKISAYEKRK